MHSMMPTHSVQNGIGAGAAAELRRVARTAHVADNSIVDIRAKFPVGITAETCIRELRSCVAIALRMQDNCPKDQLKQINPFNKRTIGVISLSCDDSQFGLVCIL